MVAITSISPTHINKDIQKKAIDGWIELGMKVISVNSKKEIVLLENDYPNVEFIPTVRTLEKTYGKPYVQISAIIDICKEYDQDDYFCIINSDIELKSDNETIKNIEEIMTDYVVMSNRVNHSGNYIGAKYLAGIDVFFLHKRFLNSYPESMHGLGMTFIDYFIAYTATQAGIPTMFIEQNFAYHLEHPAQYSSDSWKKSGRYFLWENELYQFSDTNGIGKMSTFVFEYIYNASITKKI